MSARPYVRIVPMHITIIVGFGLFESHALATLILFVLPKMAMDVTIGIIDYRQLKGLTKSEVAS